MHGILILLKLINSVYRRSSITMNIFDKLDILGALLGVNPDSLDPEIILDGMPQWNSATQKCHITGRMRWKSTLQNVTKRMRNMNSGRIVLKNGPITWAGPSRKGTKANTR